VKKLFCLTALAILAARPIFAALPSEIHYNKSFARAFGKNSATVWLIENGLDSQQINPAWFNALVANAIDRQNLDVMLESDIRAGNGLAAAAVKDCLVNAGFSPQAAQQTVLAAANGGNFPYWSTLLSTNSLAPIVQYFLAGDEDADSVAKAFMAWNSPQQKLPDPVYQIALRATGLNSPHPPKDVAEIWEYTRRICSSFGGGANQAIRHINPVAGAYAAFWQTVLERLDKDSSLNKEYLKRVTAAQLAFSLWNEPLQGSINSEAGSQFLKDYFQNYPTTRSNSLWQSLGATQQTSIGDIQAYLRDNLASNPKLADYFFWIMTRPAEAASLNTRAALVQNLAGELPAIRIFLDNIGLLGGKWFNAFALSYSWAECPLRTLGGLETLRSAYQNGQLTDRDLLSFGQAVSRHLATSDDAWFELWNAADFSPALQSLFIDSVSSSPGLLQAWAELLRGHALLSTKSFAALNPDITNLNGYLVGAASAKTITDTNRLDFAHRFKSFVQASGWKSIRDDIGREITLRNSLKKIYLQFWQRNPAKFWNLYSQLSALPKMDFISQKVAKVIAADRTADFTAAQITAYDLSSANVCSAVFIRLFKDSAARLLIYRKIDTASPLGSLNELRTGAMSNALASSKLREKSAGLLASAGVATDNLPVWITTHPKEAWELHQNLSASVPDYRAAWERSVISLVIYSGKGPLLMSSAITSDPQLITAWRESFNAEVAANPEFLKYLVPSLARQTSGSLDFEARLRAIQQSIQTALLDERFLWENVMAFPDGRLSDLINPQSQQQP
jgi:hypothetical protein